LVKNSTGEGVVTQAETVLDPRLSRRRLLQAAAATVPAVAGLGSLGPLAATPARADGPILKPLPPEWFTILGTNAETRFEALKDTGYITPVERFFVRDHTATPLIDATTWRLRIFGSGLRGAPLELSYDQLRALPSTEITCAIECAGNGRSFYGTQQGTPAPGSQWKLGAIGVARWRGVLLRDLLELAGIRRRHAVDLMPEGLDATVVVNGVDQGHVRRPLPVDKALRDVLVAYDMNGAPLLPDHGFPARLVVPGWIGIANIKWLGQIEVADHPLFSFWNTTQYRLTGPTYPPDSPPITNQVVKSAFELPFPATLPAGVPQVLTGRSWSGHRRIRRVDVSLDGGATWKRARLGDVDEPKAWVQWQVDWTPPAPGSYELLARATDGGGRVQPDAVPFNDGGYLFWAVVRHPVTVTG
jgi:DMSO/TMAO reductase YedYZ molybdopterin-dependent catalytic subunit